MNYLKDLVFVMIFVTFTWAIYVPEHTRNNVKLNTEAYVPYKQSFDEIKAIRKDLQQSVNTYLLKLNNNDDNKHNDAHQAKKNSHLLSPIPRQQKSYDIDDDVDVIAKNHTANVHENLEAQPTGLAIQQKHKLNNNDVLTELIKQNEYRNSLQHSRQRRQLSDFLIAPNTRWCGRGNTANGTYNQLGGASMADKCCRTHDHCKFYISAMSNRFELFNYRPYTLSHCNCDRRFRTCLQMANDEAANTIGKLFFNLVQTQCFVLTKEVVCLQRANDGICRTEHIKQKAYLRNNKKY